MILCWFPVKADVLPFGAAMTIVLDPACVVRVPVPALAIDNIDDGMVLMIVLVLDEACCNIVNNKMYYKSIYNLALMYR